MVNTKEVSSWTGLRVNPWLEAKLHWDWGSQIDSARRRAVSARPCGRQEGAYLLRKSLRDVPGHPHLDQSSCPCFEIEISTQYPATVEYCG